MTDLMSSNNEHWVMLLISFAIGFISKGYYKTALCIFLLALYKIFRLFPVKKVKDNSLNVVIVGCGFGGINMGIKLKEVGVRFTIYEKSKDLGGTWYDNTYPGCACDIASHLYSYSFHLNPNWSLGYSKQEEILQYLKDVVEYFGLKKHIEFNTQVISAKWNATKKVWIVETNTGETISANILISSVGLLRVPKIPEIQAIQATLQVNRSIVQNAKKDIIQMTNVLL